MRRQYSNFIVYKHTSPSGKCYIGYTGTSPQKRWGSSGKNYLRKDNKGKYVHLLFALAIKKYGWDNITHEILYTHLSCEQAKQIEIQLIAHYKALGLSYNITDGGDGTSGVSFSDEERALRAIRARQINRGKHLSLETRQKISAKRKENSRGPLPQTTKQKISEARKGKPHPHKGNISEASRKAVIEAHKIKVLKFSKDGVFLQEYSSLTEAAKDNNTYNGNIAAACKGRVKSAGGFIWRYKEN